MKKVKRFLCICLCIMLSLPVLNAYAFCGKEIHDGASERMKNDIRKMHIFDCYTRFVYEDYQTKVSREEFCSGLISFYIYMTGWNVVAVLDEIPERRGKSFADTASYAAERAYELGFVNGTHEGCFSPERLVTREEVAVMLKRMFDAMEIDMAHEMVIDVQNVSPWAVSAVEALWSSESFDRILNDDTMNAKAFVTREEMISMFWGFVEDVMGEQVILLYEDTELEILAEFGIVSKIDWKKEGYITIEEAFDAFCNLDADEFNLGYWKEGADDELKKYDYSDAQKDLLVGMTYGLTNPLLTYSEYEDIDFEKNLTYCDAYLYITRLLMDSSGCQRISHEYLVPIDSEVLFGVMYEKGLLDEIKLEDAQKDIPRQEFYSLLHKALFCDFIRGGYINNRYRYIDGLIEKYINENTVNEAKEIMEKNGMRKS